MRINLPLFSDEGKTLALLPLIRFNSEEELSDSMRIFENPVKIIEGGNVEIDNNLAKFLVKNSGSNIIFQSDYVFYMHPITAKYSDSVMDDIKHFEDYCLGTVHFERKA